MTVIDDISSWSLHGEEYDVKEKKDYADIFEIEPREKHVQE